MPKDAKEAAARADAIAAGEWKKIGSVCRWPAERVRAGDWSPAQWYDPELAEITRRLEAQAILIPASEVIAIGASVQQAHPAYKRLENGEGSEDQLMIFDSISAKLRRTMLGFPEQVVAPRNRESKKHERVFATKGHLLLAQRHNTISGRLTALYSNAATIGFGWMPAPAESRETEKGICAWWNSTPGRLLLLNRRAKTLTYPNWSKDHLRSIPVPPPDRLAPLTAVWEARKNDELLPLRDGDRCLVRLALDEAAAAIIGEDPAVVADWRRRLAAEPTISGKMAPEPGVATAAG